MRIEQTSGRSAQSGYSGVSVKLLYFEDNATDARLVQAQFDAARAFQAQITVVQRLGEGLSLLQSQHFDLALLDLNLPDSHGMASLDWLRGAAPDLPVIVVSGNLDNRAVLELLSRGAEDCLGKGEGLGRRLANIIPFILHRQKIACDLEQRAHEAEATRAQERTILDASLDAVIVLDPQGNVRYANPAAEVMFSRKAAELLGQPLGLPLVTGETTEIDIVRRNGENGSAEIRVTEIDWEGGRANLAMLRDITERKKMQAALRHGEKLQALGTLAGGIAHDFNNIILAVSGNARLALDQLSAEHPAYGNILEIAKAGSRAVALTKKILSFSSQQEIALHPTSLEPVVEEAVSLLRPTLPTRLEVQRNFPPGLPPIMADASQIHQIIVNLVTNAADAMGDRPGRVEISAAPVVLNGNGSPLSAKLPSGKYVRLSFRDTGPGIDIAIQPRIFEPFFTTKTQGRGTGMGLAIVHGIMKNHLGEVTVYSEPGKGAIFNLYFPVAKEAPTASLSPARVPAGEGQHILYLDDEEPLVLLITRTLQRLGYQVMGFTNPLDALRALRQDPCNFEAVITDLSMPQMSGTEFAQEVLHICPKMPVLLTTGYIRAQDQDLARKIGVRELILKPDTVEELGSALHRVLSTSVEANPGPLSAETKPSS